MRARTIAVSLTGRALMRIALVEINATVFRVHAEAGLAGRAGLRARTCAVAKARLVAWAAEKLAVISIRLEECDITSVADRAGVA